MFITTTMTKDNAGNNRLSGRCNSWLVYNTTKYVQEPDNLMNKTVGRGFPPRSKEVSIIIENPEKPQPSRNPCCAVI